MRKQAIATVIAALLVTSVGAAPALANAQDGALSLKKDDEIKNPAAANAAVAKDEARYAKRKDRAAHRHARVAAHKAKIAAKKADEAAKAANPSQ